MKSRGIGRHSNFVARIILQSGLALPPRDSGRSSSPYPLEGSYTTSSSKGGTTSLPFSLGSATSVLNFIMNITKFKDQHSFLSSKDPIFIHPTYPPPHSNPICLSLSLIFHLSFSPPLHRHEPHPQLLQETTQRLETTSACATAHTHVPQVASLGPACRKTTDSPPARPKPKGALRFVMPAL